MKEKVETFVIVAVLVVFGLWLLSHNGGSGGEPDGCLPGVSC